MNPGEYDAFAREYERLSGALDRYKQSPEDILRKADAYFHVLKKYSFDEVIAKADRWLATETKFPKPAEWASVVVTRSVALEGLSPEQAREWQRAEQQRWQDTPCNCRECVVAGVTDQPRRFVPVFDHEDREVKARIGDRTITTGEWIHGFALKRWYLARAEFYGKAQALKAAGSPIAAAVLNPELVQK